jgi:peptide/nickel transport system ATP-binding protein
MYMGRIVELGDVEPVFTHPRHPYTRALLSAVPIPDPKAERAKHRTLLTGDVASASTKLEGCRFRTRCPTYKQLREADQARCERDDPALVARGVTDVASACHYPS